MTNWLTDRRSQNQPQPQPQPQASQSGVCSLMLEMACAVVICKVCKAARLLGVAIAEAQGQFRKPEGERLLLEPWKPLPNNGSDLLWTLVCM
jgi:hypothetical protein